VSEAAEPTRRGRPPDLGFSDRVRRAALEVYAESGWSGFTIDAVASRASAGKASIYRRWANKQQLLVDALLQVGPEMTLPDPRADIREQLTVYARSVVDAISRPSGLILVRAQLDAKWHPDVLGTAMESLQGVRLKGAQTMVAEAIARGELPEGTSTTLLFDMLRGSILNHFLSLPADRESEFAAHGHEFAARVVSLLLTGLGAGLPIGSDNA